MLLLVSFFLQLSNFSFHFKQYINTNIYSFFCIFLKCTPGWIYLGCIRNIHNVPFINVSHKKCSFLVQSGIEHLTPSRQRGTHIWWMECLMWPLLKSLNCLSHLWRQLKLTSLLLSQPCRDTFLWGAGLDLSLFSLLSSTLNNTHQGII